MMKGDVSISSKRPPTVNVMKRRESFMSDAGVDIASRFEEILKNEPSLPTAIAAIKTLMLVLENCSAETLQELLELLKFATAEMKSKVDCSVSSVVSGSELFLRFITLASRLEEGTFEEMRKKMLTKGKHFLDSKMQARSKIAKLGAQNINDGSSILVHSKSRNVVATLVEAHKMNKRFKIYVTESSFGPSADSSDKSSRNGASGGYDMKRDLKGHNIQCTVILDAAVGYILESVDCVMLGAEGVVESGGLINKIGTYTIALCAKELNKPVYVMCESFKFVRLYPLNQRDLPDEFKYYASTLNSNEADLSLIHPLVDYTPPSLLTLLFTDLGILTPSAVSDELIKLYL